jgi:membrane glycosyltransferase
MTEGDWLNARDRALLYVRVLSLSAAEGLEFVIEAIKRAQATLREDPGLSPISETMRLLRGLLAERLTAEEGSIRALKSHPPLNRGAMVPETMYRRFGRTLPSRFMKARRKPGFSTRKEKDRVREDLQEPWEKSAFWRRSLLLLLVLTTTAAVSSLMAILLLRRGNLGLELLLVLLFAVLFAWISIGFWASVFGYLTLARRFDRFAVAGSSGLEDVPLPPEVRTAILIPVCDEEVYRVFAGLYATYQSLSATGYLENFDFFVLSDTSSPDTWVKEEAAWADLCRSLGEFDRIFYRRRRVNLKRKSGNVADFCRRWGRNYRYMVVFDADSIMAGQTLVRMVRLMENHPGIGILQTAPLTVNHETLFARLQQFANHVYGPLFAAGLHFWQLGDGQYWGHNAIIRVEPFMQHCGLPRLPGNPPLGGDILSHDFVEATLMRRAGWGVWLAYDLGGSFEEMPPSLLAELKRDRRWCQGNLQHMRLLFTRGIFPAHRALFLNGAMSYVSALFWFVFLGASTVAAMAEALSVPNYFPRKFSLFPHWPVWRPEWALILLGMTAVILFLPKLLSAVYILFHQRRARDFGGGGKLLLGVLAEAIFSSLFAPIRMMFHSKFVIMTLLGQKVGWGTQSRSDQGTGWLEAFRFHGVELALGVLWGTGVYWINPSFFWWLAPILLSLVLSIPLTVYFSRSDAGLKFREAGLFLIPEEIHPPEELVWLRNHLRDTQVSTRVLSIERGDGFRRAVVDPAIHTLHLSFLGENARVSESIAQRRRQLRKKALVQGPDCLTHKEKMALLSDHLSMRALHCGVWELQEEGLARAWGLASLHVR